MFMVRNIVCSMKIMQMCSKQCVYGEKHIVLSTYRVYHTQFCPFSPQPLPHFICANKVAHHHLPLLLPSITIGYRTAETQLVCLISTSLPSGLLPWLAVSNGHPNQPHHLIHHTPPHTTFPSPPP